MRGKALPAAAELACASTLRQPALRVGRRLDDAAGDVAATIGMLAWTSLFVPFDSDGFRPEGADERRLAAGAASGTTAGRPSLRSTDRLAAGGASGRSSSRQPDS